MRRLLALASCALVLATTGANAAARPEWADRAPMRQARTEAAYAVAGGKVYAVGGFVVSLTNSTSVEVYDVARDTWGDGPPIPLALNHAMAASLGNELYVAGGYLAVVFGATNTLFALRDGVWTPLAPMPETRAAGGMVAYGGKLWVFGGFSQQGTLATTTLVYDPRTNAWETRPGLPTAREHLTVVTDGKYVYAAGGRTGSPATNMNVVERFDPKSGKWTTLRPLTTKRSGHVSAITANGLLVSAGGEFQGGIFDAVEAYDLRRNRTYPLPALDPGRTGFGGFASGSTFYVFSGATDSGYTGLTQSLKL